jgi:hypothetical protein
MTSCWPASSAQRCDITAYARTLDLKPSRNRTILRVASGAPSEWRTSIPWVYMPYCLPHRITFLLVF